MKGIRNGLFVWIFEVSLTRTGLPNLPRTLAVAVVMNTFEKWKAPKIPRLKNMTLYKVCGLDKPYDREFESMLKLTMRFCLVDSRLSFSALSSTSITYSLPLSIWSCNDAFYCSSACALIDALSWYSYSSVSLRIYSCLCTLSSSLARASCAICSLCYIFCWSLWSSSWTWYSALLCAIWVSYSTVLRLSSS